VKRYNSKSRCCKCGCSEVSSLWADAVPAIDLPERIQRTCARCSYVWDERLRSLKKGAKP